jgi:hypothetical protein
MPESHRRYANRNFGEYRSWAEKVGPSVVEAVLNQFAGRDEFSAKSCKGCDQLQHLARKYGESDLEAACQHAKTLASLTITSIKSILRRRVHKQTDTELSQFPLPLHSNIRGSNYYSQGVNSNA